MKNWIILFLSGTLVFVSYLLFVDNKHEYTVSAEIKHGSKTGEMSSSTNQIAQATPQTLTGKLEESVEASPSNLSEHSQIPDDIKAILCSVDSAEHTCSVNLNIDYKAQLITKDNKLKQSEIGVLLSSTNFADLMQDIANNKTNDDAFVRENNYLDLLNIITTDIAGINQNKLACDNTLCALSINVADQKSWQEFSKQFFASGDDKGNLFVQLADFSDQNQDTRVLFFPDNKNGVIRRMK
jgi:hypothetical protein